MALLKNSSTTYRYVLTKHFKNQLKFYLKKDPSLKARFLRELESKPIAHHTRISSELLKVRISGQNSGKSKGYRVYIFILQMEAYLAPIVIYSKSEQTSLKQSEILGHLRATKIELGLL